MTHCATSRPRSGQIFRAIFGAQTTRVFISASRSLTTSPRHRLVPRSDRLGPFLPHPAGLVHPLGPAGRHRLPPLLAARLSRRPRDPRLPGRWPTHDGRHGLLAHRSGRRRASGHRGRATAAGARPDPAGRDGPAALEAGLGTAGGGYASNERAGSTWVNGPERGLNTCSGSYAQEAEFAKFSGRPEPNLRPSR